MYFSNVSHSIYNGTTHNMGVRPVLKLDSTVRVTGGLGTYESPYTISPRDNG